MSVYIKDMDMPADCLACRIACDKENYGVVGRPPKCPLAEAPVGDLISRADALAFPIRIDHYDREHGNRHFVLGIESVMEYIENLPSADAVSREEYDQLEALYDAIRIYDSSAEAVQGEWEKTKLKDDMWICSACGSPLTTDDISEIHFCPNCGARMKGGDDK